MLIINWRKRAARPATACSHLQDCAVSPEFMPELIRCLRRRQFAARHCFFTPTASLQDISEDLYEIFEDSEHAFLLASIVQSLFLTIEDTGKLPLCIPDNIHLPLKS